MFKGMFSRNKKVAAPSTKKKGAKKLDGKAAAANDSPANDDGVKSSLDNNSNAGKVDDSKQEALTKDIAGGESIVLEDAEKDEEILSSSEDDCTEIDLSDLGSDNEAVEAPSNEAVDEVTEQATENVSDEAISETINKLPEDKLADINRWTAEALSTSNITFEERQSKLTDNKSDDVEGASPPLEEVGVDGVAVQNGDAGSDEVGLETINLPLNNRLTSWDELTVETSSMENVTFEEESIETSEVNDEVEDVSSTLESNDSIDVEDNSISKSEIDNMLSEALNDDELEMNVTHKANVNPDAAIIDWISEQFSESSEPGYVEIKKHELVSASDGNQTVSYNHEVQLSAECIDEMEENQLVDLISKTDESSFAIELATQPSTKKISDFYKERADLQNSLDEIAEQFKRLQNIFNSKPYPPNDLMRYHVEQLATSMPFKQLKVKRANVEHIVNTQLQMIEALQEKENKIRVAQSDVNQATAFINAIKKDAASIGAEMIGMKYERPLLDAAMVSLGKQFALVPDTPIDVVAYVDEPEMKALLTDLFKKPGNDDGDYEVYSDSWWLMILSKEIRTSANIKSVNDTNEAWFQSGFIEDAGMKSIDHVAAICIENIILEHFSHSRAAFAITYIQNIRNQLCEMALFKDEFTDLVTEDLLCSSRAWKKFLGQLYMSTMAKSMKAAL